MNDFFNVTIDQAGADILLKPGGNDRLPISLRNNGNTPNTLNITLQAISADGVPIEDMVDAIFFAIIPDLPMPIIIILPSQFKIS